MNIDKPKRLWQLTFEGAWPTAVAFLGSSRRVAAGNLQGQIYVWDLPQSTPAFAPKKGSERQAPDQAPARGLEGHTHGVTRLVATRDGQQLISASLDHTLRLWQPAGPATGKSQAILDVHERLSQAKREGKKKDEILSARGVTVETLPAAKVFEGHGGWVTALGLSGDERRLISGDSAARVIVWQLAERREIARWSGLPWNTIQSVALSPDGQTAVVSECCDKRDDFDIPAAALRVFDASSGDERLDILHAMFPKYDRDESAYGAAQVWRKFVARGLVGADISPDGQLVAFGQGGETSTGKVQLVDVASGKLVREVSGHQGGVTDVKFSADGRFLLSTGRDTTLRFCQVANGKEVAVLGAPRGGQFKDWLSALAISPDQQTVAATDIAGLVHVWSLA